MNSLKRIRSSQSGMILALVMSFLGIMMIGVAAVTSMIQHDMRYVSTIKEIGQARYVAEAGIHHALAKLKTNGFSSRTDFSGTLSTGSYNVAYSTVGGRYMITSVGTAAGRTRTVKVEVRDKTPTALNYFSGAGNDITIKIHTWINVALITGDIHANHNVTLDSQPHSEFVINGEVEACGTVTEGTRHDQSDNSDTNLYINSLNNDQATVYESANLITFPDLDFTKYKQAAIDSDDGSYFDSSQSLSGSYSPANGIVYVDGDVTLSDDTVINGGLIANTISIPGGTTLTQVKTGIRNVVVAKSGNIQISGRLEAEEAVILAYQDILTHEHWGAEVVVNGCMLAKRNIQMWNTRTELDYTHIYIEPPDMTAESSGISVVSWTE
ncbi:MAG: hypothetical protein PHH49_08410 [Candidatus Omnitrophica bacterium]|nr:hypothetical protein [Candidatus Omnitrophota bacterium]MDD5488960.1 hypothetical protein [Candidatus Omnitrophota bacterium]